MQNKKFSPIKYLKEKGRKLPIDRCLISDAYERQGLTICLIVRKQPSGKFSFANILIDRYCLGVRNSMADCNFSEFDLEEHIQNLEQNAAIEEVSPEYLHNMVYGAIDFAEDLGFKPPKDFYIAEYLLDEELVTDAINDIEMGQNGKPLYIEGPYDNAKRVIATLNASVGKDGFDHIVSAY